MHLSCFMAGVPMGKEKLDKSFIREIETLKRELEQAKLENKSLFAQLHAQDVEFTKLSLVAGNTTESVVITDKHAIVEYVNPGFTLATGYLADEVIGKKISILKSDAHDEYFYSKMWQTITAGEVWSGTLVDKRKDGTFFPCLMTITPVLDYKQDIVRFVAVQKNITKERELEEQFIQAQKMEAIGILVGGVAHDFNNILTAMQGNIFLAKRKIDERPYVQDKLESLGLLTASAATMVKQMLAFARKDELNEKTFALNVFMKEGFKLVRAAIPGNVKHHCNTCQEKLVVRGDASQLLQVLMNLVNNACHAVRGTRNPEVNCTLSYYQADDAFLQKHSLSGTKEFAMLSVSDNGQGIAAMHLKKIFEPFYTTKGAGEGTGLGLSMVFSSVLRYGGAVEVETEEGRGTVFQVFLPLLESGVQPIPGNAERIMMGKGETILLVDGENRVREVTGQSLTNMNYRVIEAESGVEALQLMQNLKCNVDLLISDMMMPVLGGSELLSQLRMIHAQLPAILVSGHDRGLGEYTLQGPEKTIHMTKPFEYDVLSNNLRTLLERAD